MRSSLGSIRTTQLHSQIGGMGSMSMIRSSNNIVSRDSKFSVADEIANFDKFLGSTPITEKDYTDIKKLGLIYKKYENSDIYYGQSDNQKPHGQGIYVFWSIPSDRKPYFYKGGFENGEYNGFGKLCKMINQREATYCYQGYWKNGKREGQGKQNYNADNTMFYKGSWLNDQRHGHGVLVMPDGNFDGMWKNGKMNGDGTLTCQRGPLKTVIIGEWIDDQISQGAIQYYSKSNNQLIGEYKGGIRNLMREGQGLYRNGNIQIQGHFQNDDLVSNSTLKQITPQAQYILKGDLTQAELKRFEAEVKYKNNDKYQGLVDITPNHLIRRTRGIYTFSDGERVEGQFQDNQRGQLIYKKL